MRLFKYGLVLLVWLSAMGMASAHVNPNLQKATKPKKEQADRASYRMDCELSTRGRDMAVNNVRSRLLTGGDLWWDGSNGNYIVPRVPEGSGLEEVAAIFAGAVWLGGIDPGNNLKVACQTYGRSSGQTDFWSGPLTDEGQVGVDTCVNWDRFFVVADTNIIKHRRAWEEAVAANGGDPSGVELDPGTIPEDVRGWPGLGNPYFFDIHGFELPSGNKGFNGLAGFWDEGGQIGIYEPQLGDFPIIQIRGCDENQFPPTEQTFYCYNDAGGIHTESNGDQIQMEIQVQAFAYTTNDQINDMTFQRYRLINRAIEIIDSTYFAMWVDPDLGCFRDDFVGCDTSRSLAFVYNADDLDGEATCNDCGAGVATYCTEIPALGVDYFRGPLDEFGEEIGMSSFTYYDNGGYNPIQAMTDPQEAIEYYNYLSGSWRDGTRFTAGGTGYNPISTEFINYAFTERPDDASGWSMCSQNLGLGDRRTIQASGPFLLRPGTINELIIGVVWVPDLTYPCPDLTKLFVADDIAQSLFNNCFELTNGPWAPDVDWVELDEEIIAVLSNENPISNNFREQYIELDLAAPRDDSIIYFYQFEGYQIYQLPSATPPSDFNDPDQARLVESVDLKNGIRTIYNWDAVVNPNRDLPGEPEAIYVPELEVEGVDEGIKHTFRITEDRFGGGNLINHRPYYYTVIAYGYNNWLTFNQQEINPQGQQRPYIPSNNNIRQFTVVPRPIVDSRLNAQYGDGPQVTRLEGSGVGGKFVEITDETRDAILGGSFDGSVVYKPGQGPINVTVYNPLEIQDGDYELYFRDSIMNDTILEQDAGWLMVNLSNSDTVFSDRSIETLNEQIIGEFGFSISIEQTLDAGSREGNNGALGIEVEYVDELGEQWFNGVIDNDQPPLDFIKTGSNEPDNVDDPNQSFVTQMAPGYWQPYRLVDYRPILDGNVLLTPAWDNQLRNPQVRLAGTLDVLNNVDIIMTSDKSKWSRCVVVESASRLYFSSIGSNKPTEGGTEMFDVRSAPSVTPNDNNGDGLPDVDASESRPGFGWFPGYAIDVESGERLNIFFGENTTYDCASLTEAGLENLCGFLPDNGNGRDMMWNPTSEVFIPELINPSSNTDMYPVYAGGHHFIYVTRQSYDGCEELWEGLNGSSFQKVDPLSFITWTCMPLATTLDPLGSGNTGLIPNDITFRLRVDNPYQTSIGDGSNNRHPAYRFSFNGAEKSALTTQAEFDEELDQIRMVPNPYYGYSIYETSQFTNTVKITNLPAECDINIFSLDGRFIRRYQRNETPGEPNGVGAATRQINPDLEWDLKNSSGITVASGTYLIHVNAPGKGERVLKFFAVLRQFDPSGL